MAQTTRKLIDNLSGETIGIATDDQCGASDAIPNGIISINEDGDIVRPGTWDFDNLPHRDVWVEKANWILATPPGGGYEYRDDLEKNGLEPLVWMFDLDSTVYNLQGLLNGTGNKFALDWNGDEWTSWVVCEIPSGAKITSVKGDLVEVDRCIVRHVGDQDSATQFLRNAGITGPILEEI